MLKIEVTTRKRIEAVDITSKINAVLKGSGVCLLYVPHTTAGITVNEGHDPSVMEDVMNRLSALVPTNLSYAHLEGNADAHIKAVIVGQSLLLPFSDGKLTLGTWQKVFFMEFDGPRCRSVWIKVISHDK